MNRLEELELKWDATNMIFFLPIMIMGVFAVLSFLLTYEHLYLDCTKFNEDWRINLCIDIKNNAIYQPTLFTLVMLGMIVFREVLKRTCYKEVAT